MSSAKFHPALTKAAQAVVSDNREETRQNIEWFLSEQPDHPEGLLFQAWTADSLDTAYDCIQRAMDIDPNNLIAQAGMNWIQGVWNLAEEQIEADRLEAQRLEAERLEQERLEQERLEAERLEAERLEAERLEQERLEQERLEQERLEQERLEQERLEQERLEQERLEQERLEQERLEQERLEQERLEQERLEQERLEQERLEQERLEQERLEQERLEQERLEQERLEQERLEAEHLEAARLEAEHLEAARLEAQRLEQERLEQERLEAERLEQEELERLEQERLAAEQEAQQRHDREVEEAAAKNKFQEDLEMDDAVVVDNEYDSAEMDELAAQEQAEQAEPNVIGMDFDEISGNEETYEVARAQPDDLVLIDDKDVVSFENEATFENQEKSFADVAAEAEVAEEPAQAVENESADSVDNDSVLAHVLPMASPENQLQQSVESLVEEVRQEVTSPESVFADEAVMTEAANAETPQISEDGNRKPVILAVDDSASIRKLVSLTLREQGYEVVTAADGVEALKILAEQLPDLILSDINMPRLGGYKLCKFVKKHERTASIPVIMLSGKDGVFDKMRGKMNGCDGFIGKPFETQELIETISHYLPITTS